MALTPSEALRTLGSPFAAEDVGLSATPVVAIDLRIGQLASSDAAALEALISRTPAVVIGWCSPETSGSLLSVALACDVLVSDEKHPSLPVVVSADGAVQALNTIVERTGDRPLAAVTLVQLLRLGVGLGVTDALLAESLAYSTLLSGPAFARWLAGRSAGAPKPTAQPKQDSDAPLVRVAIDGGTQRISLNDPSRHNAFSAALRDQLVESLRVAAANPDLARLSIDGIGPSFCTGGDLTEFGTTPDPATGHRIRSVRSPASWLHQIDAPIQVHLHGHVIGAGLELAAFADRVTIDPGAQLSLPEVEMGLIPGAGGTVSLPRRIGRQRTAWLALSGETIDAAISLDWGLADALQRDYPHLEQ